MKRLRVLLYPPPPGVKHYSTLELPLVLSRHPFTHWGGERQCGAGFVVSANKWKLQQSLASSPWTRGKPCHRVSTRRNITRIYKSPCLRKRSLQKRGHDLPMKVSINLRFRRGCVFNWQTCSQFSAISNTSRVMCPQTMFDFTTSQVIRQLR